jgi:CRISPR-associated endonuclease/helicase Cas3
MTSVPTPAIGFLWGKSNPQGVMNLLVQHLLDTAAVAELIWDRYLAANIKEHLDACCNGRGRAFFSLLCGLHDIGKATPAFQCKADDLAQRVRSVGLTWRRLDAESKRWHHSCAGAVILQSVLREEGWHEEAISWVWPMVAGHHGLIPERSIFSTAGRLRDAQGRRDVWGPTQAALVRVIADELNMELSKIVPSHAPRRAVQLALSGAVIMADWIASGSHFGGIDEIRCTGMAIARDRAAKAWASLELRGGWGGSSYQPVPDLVVARFGKSARPLQIEAIQLAEQMPAPGLLFIEAPMGEGKTEAALAAVEVLGRRFGCDGVFVGMPTQATSDPMFDRMLRWAGKVQQGLPVGLLHGKRMFNPKWQELQEKVHFAGIDELGCYDDFEMAGTGTWKRQEQAPAEWFLGPKRGMLMPITVGTIDNLLHAATRTKHVMLRHAGLVGRVVILDEIHAYDVYMSQFLCEALRWLADAGIPVILLSATLPPEQRDSLTRAYLQGVRGRREINMPSMAVATGYPILRAVTAAEDGSWPAPRTPPSWRPSVPVGVRVHDEAPDEGPDNVARLVDEELRDGGCALVIRNTVGRAQQTYAALKDRLGADQVILLHGRLTIGERAARTQRVLGLLGPPDADNPVKRPDRLVVVATQLAEQSFDVDADLLVTDLAPIDLLLQRIGRIHRHERGADARPARLSKPQVIVAGLKTNPAGPPTFSPGSRYVYGRHLLLRAAALVLEAAAGKGWDVPAQVPELVARGYGRDDITPAQWQEAASRAHGEWEASQQRRRGDAASFLLSGEDQLGAPTLEGLHGRATGELRDDDAVAAVVRDGPETVEVVLVRRVGERYLTLSGRDMGPNGDGVSDTQISGEVVGSALRLPPQPAVTEAAKVELGPLPGWENNAWLRRARALPLDEKGFVDLGGYRLTYDTEVGLLSKKAS